MPRAGLLLGRQQGQGEGGGGGRVVSERPPMLGDAIGLRSRGRGGGIPASPPSYQPQNFPPSNMVENRASKFFAKGVANIRINLVKAKKIGYDHGIRLMVTKIFSVILGIRERHLSRPTFLSSFQIKQPCGGTKTRQAPRLTSFRKEWDGEPDYATTRC